MDLLLGVFLGGVLMFMYVKSPPKVGWFESFKRTFKEKFFAIDYKMLNHPFLTGIVDDPGQLVPFRAVYMPILKGLKPTRYSTYIKLGEELGEISEILGKFQGKSGEVVNISQKELDEMLVKELLDLTQVCFTYINVLEEDHGLDVGLAIQEHVTKLYGKGYLK